MQALPPAVHTLILNFAPLCSKRVFASARLLLVGAILSPGKRTVTSLLGLMGQGQSKAPTCQTDPRVLNRARWSALQGSRLVLLQWGQAFAPRGPLLLGLDDTIERRGGPKMAARGLDRDPVRSSPSYRVNPSGLRWVCLMVLAPVSWAPRVWAFPCLTVLAPSARAHEPRGRRPRTVWDRAAQAIALVKRGLPARASRGRRRRRQRTGVA